MSIVTSSARPKRPATAMHRPAWLPHPGVLAFILALWVMATALQFGHLFH